MIYEHIFLMKNGKSIKLKSPVKPKNFDDLINEEDQFLTGYPKYPIKDNSITLRKYDIETIETRPYKRRKK